MSTTHHPETETRSWFARPLSGLMSLTGWLVATGVFFAIMYALGGPSEGDFAESAYSIWAMAHAHFACDFISSTHFNLGGQANPYAPVAPLFPMIGAALFDLFRLGHVSSAYPSVAAMGSHCQNAVQLAFQWTKANPGVVVRTLRTGEVGWFFLLWGYLDVMRTTKWKSTVLEALGAVLLALNLPIAMPLAGFYHPQDLIAIGLSLVAVGQARRGHWVRAGVYAGLGFTSQQMALFVVVLLLALAPWTFRRVTQMAPVRLLAGAGAAVAAIGLPVILTSPIGGLRAVVLGSSRAGQVRGFGGTVLWELNLHGFLQFFVARVAPFLATAVIGVLARRRYGDRVFEAPILASLVTLAFLTRLVFEINLFGYYFAAAAVSLMVADLVAGKVRGTTWAWIGLIIAAFEPVHVGLFSNWTTWEIPLHYIVLDTMIGIAVLSMLADVRRREFRPFKAFFVAVVVLTTSWLPGTSVIFGPPNWLWQIYLVPEGINLALQSLWAGAKAPVALEEPSESDDDALVGLA